MSFTSQMPALLLALMQGSCRDLTSNVLFLLIEQILLIGRKNFYLSIRPVTIGFMSFRSSPRRADSEDQSCLPLSCGESHE